MYNNNIPQNNGNVKQNFRPRRGDDNRFLGGFAVPFVLGGITGSLLTPRYNYPVYYGFNRPIQYPYYPYYPYRPY